MKSAQLTNEIILSSLFSLQAVDVVGQAGKPKTITGFQTHTTPVLLAYGERAELATDQCKFLLYNFFF